MMQKELKVLKALSTGDKAEKTETLSAHEVACYSRNSTAVFRLEGQFVMNSIKESKKKITI